MASAVFTLRTVQVPASTYFGLSASSAVATPALYTAGAVQYWVYTPNTTSLATFGWTGLPYRVLVVMGSLASVLTGVGVNEGANMIEAGVVSQKLGFGANRDGSAQNAEAPVGGSGVGVWPTLCVFIQGPNTWTPHISGESTRGWFMVHDAVVQDVLANYNCDPNFIYGTGVSGGGGVLMEYAMAATYWPTRYPIKYAALTTMSGTFSGSGTRQDWPEAIPGENSTNQTFNRLSRTGLLGSKIPWYEVHSTGDITASTPAIYNLWGDAVKQYSPNIGNPIPTGFSAGTVRYHGKYFRWHEFTGANAPNHGATPDAFYGNNWIVGDGLGPLLPTDPWAQWMFQQKLIQQPSRVAVNAVYNYSGGSVGPTPPTPGTGNGNTMLRRRRR